MAAVAEIGDQLEPALGLVEHRLVDLVGDGGHQDVGRAHGVGELLLSHRLVVEIEPGIEQLAHPRLDAVRQLARDDNQRLLSDRHRNRSRVLKMRLNAQVRATFPHSAEPRFSAR